MSLLGYLMVGMLCCITICIIGVVKKSKWLIISSIAFILLIITFLLFLIFILIPAM